MILNYKKLGKVCPTINGEWNKENKYDILSIVFNNDENCSYISKIDVPQNIDIHDTQYWQIFQINSGIANVLDIFTSYSIVDALSANKGRELKNLIDNIFTINDGIDANLCLNNGIYQNVYRNVPNDLNYYLINIKNTDINDIDNIICFQIIIEKNINNDCYIRFGYKTFTKWIKINSVEETNLEWNIVQ